MDEPSDQMMVFFDVDNFFPDTTGIRVVDLEQAETAAVSGLASLIEELALKVPSPIAISIRTADGRVLSRVTITVEIERLPLRGA